MLINNSCQVIIWQVSINTKWLFRRKSKSRSTNHHHSLTGTATGEVKEKICLHNFFNECFCKIVQNDIINLQQLLGSISHEFRPTNGECQVHGLQISRGRKWMLCPLAAAPLQSSASSSTPARVSVNK